jgi:hypothetical protein
MSVRREVTPRINAWRVTATLVGALILGGCKQEDATARLANDIHPDKVEIIHARFPCRSPEIHFFGYRFRIYVKTEMALGDICWDPLAKNGPGKFCPSMACRVSILANKALDEIRNDGQSVAISNPGRTEADALRHFTKKPIAPRFRTFPSDRSAKA